MTPDAATITAALEHAAACQPMESCGVIVADGAFLPVPNLANEHGHFIMDRRAFCHINISRKVTAIVHSHVAYPAVAGETDRVMCEKSGLPWIIVSWPDGHWCSIEPEGFEAPLVGREWAWGSNDCFGLMRDALKAFTGIVVPDYDRDWMFWRDGGNDIVEKFASTGYVAMPKGTKPRQCDVFAMAFRGDVVNHLAMFLEPDKILHQLYRQLSVRELYGGVWLERTRLHLRHERLL
jgi:proteasome lid subunit RPN8/RPN11